MLTRNYNVIALMSGTSLDGIDLLYVSFSYKDQWNFKIHYNETYKYSSEWKRVLSNLTNKSLEELRSLDIEYSFYLADVILNFSDSNSIQDIDFIASHGHTALHQPNEGFTYQIGNRQELSDKLKQKVICDFRIQDVKLGGQGAPLVPIGDQLLFNDYTYCLNIGGFANISFEDNKSRIAYDICPVNIVLNHYVKSLNLEYDDKGQLASKGIVDGHLLNDLNSLPYYNERAPKSLGLEWVQTEVLPLIEHYKLQIETILRTFIEHVAIQISKELKKENASVLITGGGVYNNFLIERLKSHTQNEIIIPSKEIIEFKEALIFGLLGVLKSRNEVNCLSSVTGSSKNHSSGKILTPKINI
jgi:anhydro-N-acetylmuramic acid kinase